MKPPIFLERRGLLKRAASLLAGFSVLRIPLVVAADEPPRPLVKRVVRSPANTFFTYPHSNGFLSNEVCVIAQPGSDPNAPGVDYLSFNLVNGATTFLKHVRGSRGYYSISENGLMLLTQEHGALLIDLRGNADDREILSSADWKVHADCDISPDGTKALVTRSHYSDPLKHRIDVIDIKSGHLQIIEEADWIIDHGHFSPFAPSWVCFCDGERRAVHRVWIYDQNQNSAPRTIFDQTEGQRLLFDIGHERAMYSKPALLVVAYGDSTTAARGLYEADFDGHVRLISASNRDFHCNVSRDGRWAVVSLQGRANLSAAKVDVSIRPDPTWLETGMGFADSDVLVVNMESGARRFLYRGTNATKGQPYEVQPAISPDGRWVLLKDAREQCVLALEINQAALADFLNS
jgi:hypothetical protein